MQAENHLDSTVQTLSPWQQRSGTLRPPQLSYLNAHALALKPSGAGTIGDGGDGDAGGAGEGGGVGGEGGDSGAGGGLTGDSVGGGGDLMIDWHRL